MKFFKNDLLSILFLFVFVSNNYAQKKLNRETFSNNDELKKVCEWSQENKEAIYGVSTCEYEKPNWGYYTQKEDVIYAHVFNWPQEGKLIINRGIKVRRAYLDYGKIKLKTKLIDNELVVFLPKEAPRKLGVVVKIVLAPNEDWANLERYSQANLELKKEGVIGDRVVFMGNSITQNWTRDHGVFFEENPSYVNRGISGQTSSQMMLRFRPDVIELHPKVVVISAGTNDIAENRGPISIERIAGNIFSMVELAKSNGIKVVIASVLPATSYSWSPSIEPADKIIALNMLLKKYAKKNKIVYLDYYTPMVNEYNGLKQELGRDTVHPNAVGYKIMEPLVQKAIKDAL